MRFREGYETAPGRSRDELAQKKIAQIEVQVGGAWRGDKLWEALQSRPCVSIRPIGPCRLNEPGSRETGCVMDQIAPIRQGRLLGSGPIKVLPRREMIRLTGGREALP